MRALTMLSTAAAVLAFAACEGDNAFSGMGGDGDAVVPTNSARVRFVNALTAETGNLLLLSNGTVVGTQLPFASSSSCTTVSAGPNRTLVFGGSNAAGTEITDSLATLTATLASGGNYTVLALGNSANPRLLVLDNNTSTPAAGNANVRFINATGVPVDFFASASGATLSNPTTGNIGPAAAGGFAVIPVTSNRLTFRSAGSTTTLFTGTGAFTAGQTYNVVLLPNATDTGFQMVTFTRC